MEHPQLLDVVRRPLSPDTQIEVHTSWEEVDREDARYPLLQYDAVRQIAIVKAAPTPLHTIMLTGLMINFCRNVNRQGLDENITDRLFYESEATETTSGDGATRRILNGAIRYKITDLDRLLMIAFEVGVSQTYTSLKDAISYAICVLHCPLGIILCINERGRGRRPPVEYYQSMEAMNAAIQQAENDFRIQLQHCPYGPLVADGVTWFGRVSRVILDVFRKEHDDYPEGTRLEPTIVMDGQYVGGGVSPNLAEVTLGDCIPTHLLAGNEIQTIPVNFFQQDWFENSFRSAMFNTAIARVRDKRKVVRQVQN
ncbi:uncharacterized protein V1513DRAFT_481874 [Lipomyces chichibuensis]|uniref:uncharacterized protein n=1 Tax=Lipomyces chichibuensis TaxID=1546026 RepID=UPI0033430C5E